MRRTSFRTLSALIAVATAVPAVAQSNLAPAEDANSATGPQQSDGLQDIVVTAQRRRETAQTVPIAISAFSANQLERGGVNNSLELGNFVPNLVAQNNTGIGSANSYFIRGLGNTESIATFDPPVGTYIDDVYLSRQNANNLNLFDVERIEVLRGPQGTLFGRNTTGGAINVILKEPGKTFGGFGEVGYGSFSKKLARGSLDIPLAETFQIKVSGYYQNDRGYTKNTTTGQRMNDDDGWGARLGLHGDLAPWARWNASYAHLVANGENELNYLCDPNNPSNCDGRFASTGLRNGGTLATSPYPQVVTGEKARYGNGNRTGSDIVTSNLAFDVAPGTQLTFITGYVAQTQRYALDFFDGRAGPSFSNPTPPPQGYPAGAYVLLNRTQSTQFSQEAKLNGSLFDGLVDYVTGVFYLREEVKTDYADLFTSFVTPARTGSTAIPLLLADRIMRTTTDTTAGYAQADVNITKQIKLTGGIRYTDETKTISVHDNRAACNTGGALPANCLDDANLVSANGVRIPREQSVGVWTPRFALNFTPAKDFLLFASATRGFKSGGWNARGTAPGTFLPFNPEKVWNYEAGLKSEFFDHRLRINLTAFYLKDRSLQTSSSLVNANGTITFITRNFANYENKGLEAEITVVPTRGLNLYANAGYMDDKFKLPDLPAVDAYGVQSVAAQLAACKAQLAQNVVSTGTGFCGSGIVTAQGTIATPARTPKVTLSLGGSYEIPLGDSGLTLIPAGNAAYRSAQEFGPSNINLYTGAITGSNGTFAANPNSGDFISGSHSPPGWFLNGTLALSGPDNGWQLSLECNNCTNTARPSSNLANTTYYNRPMTWLVRGRYNF